MPLTYNGNDSAAVTYNGNPVSEVTYNGVTVWQAAGSSASEFDFTLDSSHLTLDLYLTQSAANAVTVDWGDNSATESPSSTSASLTHTYSAAGNYTVSITCESGESWYPGMHINYGQSEDDFTFCGVADDATHYSTLTAIRSGNGMTLGGTYCFEYFDALTTANLSKVTGAIALNAFSHCTSLTSVTLGNGITSLGQGSFWSCSSLASIILPPAVTDIGANTFQSGGLTAIVIPDSVLAIGDNAFRSISALLSADIGTGITSIGAYGFGSCNHLDSITCRATTPPTLGSNAFRSVPATCPIYVPSASVATYQAASGWSTRAAYIQAIP